MGPMGIELGGPASPHIIAKNSQHIKEEQATKLSLLLDLIHPVFEIPSLSVHVSTLAVLHMDTEIGHRSLEWEPEVPGACKWQACQLHGYLNLLILFQGFQYNWPRWDLPTSAHIFCFSELFFLSINTAV